MSPSDPLSRLAQSVFGRLRSDPGGLVQLVNSGEFESQRSEAVKNGGLSWRILRYQRTVDPEKLGYPVAGLQFVRPDTLDLHLRYLTKNFRVISLDSLTEMLGTGRPVPDKSVVLTFDGGWIDNFVYAYPLLMKHRLPATFFMPTAFIDTQNFFWQDKVLFGMMIMRQKNLPFLPFDFFEQDEIEQLERTSPGGEITLPLVYVVISLLANRTATDRFQALSIFAAVAQSVGASLPTEPAFMSWNDAHLMDAGGMVFGSLSHGHAAVRELAVEGFRTDFRTADDLLNQHFKHVTPVYALPGGEATSGVLRILGEENVEYALGLHEGSIVTADSGPKVLPRVALCEDVSSSSEMFACRVWLGESILFADGA